MQAPVSLEVLKQVSLFSGLKEEDLQAILTRGRQERLAKRAFLFHQGEPSDRLYLILRGKVKVVKQHPSGQETILEVHGVGDSIAEVAVLDGRPYPASAQTLSECTLLRLSRPQFLEILEAHPPVARNLIVGLGRRLRDLVEHVSSLAVQPVEERLAGLLLKLAKGSGLPVSGGLLVNLSLTRQDLADIIGTSLETVVRALRRLRQRGLLTLQGRRLLITHPERLRALAEGRKER